VKGRFHGYLRGKITGGTFNPNATCRTSGSTRSSGRARRSRAT
jgi:hypothetical protein